MPSKVYLVTGGARSGKSRYAQSLWESLCQALIYLATSWVSHERVSRKDFQQLEQTVIILSNWKVFAFQNVISFKQMKEYPMKGYPLKEYPLKEYPANTFKQLEQTVITFKQ